MTIMSLQVVTYGLLSQLSAEGYIPYLRARGAFTVRRVRVMLMAATTAPTIGVGGAARYDML